MKIVVIGAGPGGYEAAIRAAQLGAEVTIIEKDKLGGTCLNVGCIPTKALIHSGDLYREINTEAKANGILVENVTFDFEEVQKKKNKVVKQLVGGVGTLMKSYDIEVIQGIASFKSAQSLNVTTADGEIEVTFDKAIIATGSVPTVVPLPGYDLPGVVDSTGALEFTEVPESLAIIGGGVIGLEIGAMYQSFGTKITIIEMLPRILTNLDSEVAGVIEKTLKRGKAQIMTETKVLSIEQVTEGLKVNVSTSAGDSEVIAQKVLMCVGRKPATEELCLGTAGVEEERGRVIVDENFKTNIDNIYAIGDCIGGIMLAHVASAEGISCVEKIMGKQTEHNFVAIPSCVYTYPEMASVGLTEEQAKEKGLSIEVGKFPMIANGRSKILNDTSGFVKIIAEKDTRKVLGMHMCGANATELIIEGTFAISKGATIDDILATIHPHPSIGESVAEAAHAVFGNAINMPPM